MKKISLGLVTVGKNGKSIKWLIHKKVNFVQKNHNN